MSETDIFVQAISIVFSASVPSRELLAQANGYLFDLSTKRECFFLAFSTLANETFPLVVRTFCGNILYKKIRTQHHQLEEHEASQLHESLGNMVLQIGKQETKQLRVEERALYHLLLRTFAALSIRGSSFLLHAAQVAQELSQFSQSEWISSFILLVSFHDEASDAHLERNFRATVQTCLSTLFNSAAYGLLPPLLSRLSPGTTGFALDSVEEQCIVSFLRAWVECGQLDSAVSLLASLATATQSMHQLASTQSSIPHAFGQVLLVLTSISCGGRLVSQPDAVSSPLITDAHSAIRALLNRGDPDESMQYKDYLLQLLLAALDERLSKGQTLPESARREVLATFQCAFLSAHYLDATFRTSLAPPCTPMSAQVGYRMLDTMLQLVRRRPRSNLLLCVDFLVEVESTLFEEPDEDDDPSDYEQAGRSQMTPEAKSFLTQSFVPRLLQVTLRLLAPADEDDADADAELEEEDDDLAAFRDPHIGLFDLLSFCLAVVGPDAFLLALSQTSLSLECVLFALSVCMAGLQRLMSRHRQSISSALLHTTRLALAQLAPCLQQIERGGDSARPWRMLSTVAQYCATLPFLLCATDDPSCISLWSEVVLSLGALLTSATLVSTADAQEAAETAGHAVEALRRLVVNRATHVSRQDSAPVLAVEIQTVDQLWQVLAAALQTHLPLLLPCAALQTSPTTAPNLGSGATALFEGLAHASVAFSGETDTTSTSSLLRFLEALWLPVVSAAELQQWLASQPSSAVASAQDKAWEHQIWARLRVWVSMLQGLLSTQSSPLLVALASSQLPATAQQQAVAACLSPRREQRGLWQTETVAAAMQVLVAARDMSRSFPAVLGTSPAAFAMSLATLCRQLSMSAEGKFITATLPVLNDLATPHGTAPEVVDEVVACAQEMVTLLLSTPTADPALLTKALTFVDHLWSLSDTWRQRLLSLSHHGALWLSAVLSTLWQQYMYGRCCSGVGGGSPPWLWERESVLLALRILCFTARLLASPEVSAALAQPQAAEVWAPASFCQQSVSCLCYFFCVDETAGEAQTLLTVLLSSGTLQRRPELQLTHESLLPSLHVAVGEALEAHFARQIESTPLEQQHAAQAQARSALGHVAQRLWTMAHNPSASRKLRVFVRDIMRIRMKEETVDALLAHL